MARSRENQLQWPHQNSGTHSIGMKPRLEKKKVNQARASHELAHHHRIGAHMKELAAKRHLKARKHEAIEKKDLYHAN